MDLNILTNAGWPNLVSAVSAILGLEGMDKPGDVGRSHVWNVFGISVIAISEPGLEDDQGIPFSTFTAQVDVVLCHNIPLEQAEHFHRAFAILLFLRLKSSLDPNARLVRNLQTEILVPSVIDALKG